MPSRTPLSVRLSNSRMRELRAASCPFSSSMRFFRWTAAVLSLKSASESISALIFRCVSACSLRRVESLVSHSERLPAWADFAFSNCFIKSLEWSARCLTCSQMAASSKLPLAFRTLHNSLRLRSFSLHI